MEPLFEGIGVALVTLFDDDLEVDAAATAAHAQALVELGVSAVLVAGTTGEAASLSDQERAALVARVREAIPPGVPVLAGTGAASARQAAAFTEDAAGAGADAALVMPPPRVDDPRPYFDVVAKAAPDLPLLAYHHPVVSPPGVPLGMLGDLPVVGMKDSSGEPDRLLAELDEWDRPVYPGSSALLAYAAFLGCPGAIVALANVDPEGCRDAFGGDAVAQRRLARLHQVVKQDGFPHGIKAATSRRFGTSTAARMG